MLTIAYVTPIAMAAACCLLVGALEGHLLSRPDKVLDSYHRHVDP